jgi:hypothetical protein
MMIAYTLNVRSLRAPGARRPGEKLGPPGLRARSQGSDRERRGELRERGSKEGGRRQREETERENAAAFAAAAAAAQGSLAPVPFREVCSTLYRTVGLRRPTVTRVSRTVNPPI